MKLSRVKTGQVFKIRAVRDKKVCPQALRLGIHEGAVFTCTRAIKHGPVMLQGIGSHIAVGHKIAEKILIDLQ